MFKEYSEIRDFTELQGLMNSGRLLIFKHSTQCPVSSAAFEEFKSFLAGKPAVQSVYVDVIRDRSVSDKIAEYFNIRHESPQALLINQGQAVFHCSHRNITKDVLIEAVSKYK